jgi:hypothetical protein
MIVILLGFPLSPISLSNDLTNIPKAWNDLISFELFTYFLLTSLAS